MSRLTIVWALCAWAGVALLLAPLRWFGRRSLAERLRPFHPTAGPGRSPGLRAESFRDALAPLARTYGESLSRLTGNDDDLALRLARAGHDPDTAGFRMRQMGWAMVAFAAGSLAAVLLAPPAPAAALFVLGSPVLTSLVVEQRLVSEAEAYQRRVFLELPVVAEQLGMLLCAGYSLGSALQRLGDRGHGVVARDLVGVGNRLRQGLSVTAALAEWAERAGVDELHRLVQVLALHQTATDLGPLITAEARAIRREAHRRQVARLEQRGQMVWVPVTVAALLPGALLLAIPFADAMRLVGG